MHDRSESIRLPVAEPRCEPSLECVVRGKCARYQAFLPLRNAAIADFSITHQGASLQCAGFLLSAAFVNLPRQAQAPRHFGPLK